MYKLIAFIILSALLAYLSRASLRMPRSHGFFRFFAAEFLVALILLNVDQWFVDPLSARQVLSWILLAASVALVLGGVLTLRVVGKPSSKRTSEVPITGIEKTTVLVDKGIYGHIRHPIYASGFYGAWGVFFKDPSWVGLILTLGAVSLWTVTARIEEAECARYFGEPYREYARQTKMFIPFLF